MGRLDRVTGIRLAAAILAIALGGCASTHEPASRSGSAGPSASGTVHVIKPGENLYRLSQHYGVSVDAIRRANDIDDVHTLQIGQRLVIPGSGIAAPSRALNTAPPARAAIEGGVRRETAIDLIWPVDGRPSSRFGGRRGGDHDGIDIPAKKGTPVRAAESGRVIESGRIGDYGNVVILKHAGRYSTVYAHNRRNRVRKGEFVEKGDVIAEVGETGNATGPHVHFEVRRDRKPENPLLYLP